MNQFTIPLKSPQPTPADGINRLTDELLMNFKVSGKHISTKSWDILAEILDFVVEAEQTIAEQKQHIEKLEVMTATDPLTGLLNRRGMIQEIEHAIAMAERYDEPSIFIYIDLDGFKEINDSYGHAIGDGMLSHIAGVLQSSIRQTDYAARLGGDEFALLLCHSEYEGGLQRGQFIQQQLNFSKYKIQNTTIPIRASFGMTEISSGRRLKDIMRHADQQMYRNKSIRKE